MTNPLAEIANLLSPAPETELAETALPEEETPEPEQELAADAPEQALEGETPAEPDYLDLSTISDVQGLETAGIDPSWLYGLKVPMPDGEEPLSVGEMKDRFTQVNRAQKDLTEQYANLRQHQEQLSQLLTAAQVVPPEVQDAAATLRALQFRLQDQPYWEALEKRSPGQAALHRQKVSEAVRAAQGELQAKLQQLQQVQMANFDSVRQRELSNLIRRVPEWKDGSLAQRETQAIGGMLQRYGFAAEEIGQMMDHRLIHAFRDMLHLQSQAQAAEKSVTQLRKAPKVLRGGKPSQPRASIRQAEQAKLAKRARETGSPEAQRAAVANLLNLEGIR